MTNPFILARGDDPNFEENAQGIWGLELWRPTNSESRSENCSENSHNLGPRVALRMAFFTLRAFFFKKNGMVPGFLINGASFFYAPISGPLQEMQFQHGGKLKGEFSLHVHVVETLSVV